MAARRLTAQNNLAALYPEIALEWHPDKNSQTPDRVTPKTSQKAWWQCKEGHEWEARVGNRTGSSVRAGTGCPYCKGKKVTETRNLLAARPELARQWHPEKNGDLKPDQVTPASGRRVWWICALGHEFQGNINCRFNYQTGEIASCPKCRAENYGKPKPQNSRLRKAVSVKRHPRLRQEWHGIKNQGKDPGQTPLTSQDKVWWVCQEGHEWQEAVASRRKRNSMCPSCPAPGSLATKKPGLVREWHPKKNKGLTPERISARSGSKVWWQCSAGHEWLATVEARSTNPKNQCPKCPVPGSIAETHPHLTLEWHPDKNGHLTPSRVTPGSSRNIWWICQEGHEWRTQVGNRTKGFNCPYCSGQKTDPKRSLAARYPQIATEWNSEKNGSVTPWQVMPQSNKKFWWHCPKGHPPWRAAPATRVFGRRCPKCGHGGGGFNPDKPATLYLLTRPDGVAQVGITGQGYRANRRLSQHGRNGYQLHCLWYIQSGHNARKLERAVIRYWREHLGAPAAAKQGESGWTETVNQAECSLQKTERRIKKLAQQFGIELVSPSASKADPVD